MYISRLAFVLAALSAASCIDKDVDNTEFYEKYARGFDNRTTVAVNIASEVAGEYYAVYFGNPYDGESLVKQPALTGFTPVSITLDVPKDVERLYVVAQGEMKSYEVGNLSISAAARPGPQSRAADVNPVSARVMTAVNSIYFPEKTNNVRGDDLFKCTDLVIDRTPSSGDFDEAEIWLTFLGDGGCRQSQLFGKLWFYTYPSSKQDGLTLGDCTFYGVKDGEVVAIPYSEVRAQRSWVFYTREEFSSNIASYKRYKLGVFPKGLNLGFVYIGNSTVSYGGFRFTTPWLNERVQDYTLTYQDDKKTFRIVDRHLANGYICHVTEGDFQGNILGMENRVVTESAKYDGDYNDILCMIESNPRTIAPGEEVEIVGLTDEKKKTVVTSMEMFRKTLDYVEAGDNVGCLLRGVAKTDIERGQVLSKPGSIHPHTKFTGQVYVLSKDEGGRHTPFFNNYRPQFYFRTTDVTGIITLPEGTEMCMPGDNVDMKVELITPIAIEKGLRFAIREGGRTVGSGVVIAIEE